MIEDKIKLLYINYMKNNSYQYILDNMSLFLILHECVCDFKNGYRINLNVFQDVIEKIISELK